MSVIEIIATLGLAPHPEGGYFRQMLEDRVGDGRAQSTAIYYLLEGGRQARWHRIDAVEVWHYYAGAPLRLSLGGADAKVLGPDLKAGQRPQVIIPAGAWQAAESLGAWTLVGCTVAPGFEFAHFEMADEGWAPD